MAEFRICPGRINLGVADLFLGRSRISVQLDFFFVFRAEAEFWFQPQFLVFASFHLLFFSPAYGFNKEKYKLPKLRIIPTLKKKWNSSFARSAEKMFYLFDPRGGQHMNTSSSNFAKRRRATQTPKSATRASKMAFKTHLNSCGQQLLGHSWTSLAKVARKRPKSQTRDFLVTSENA